MSVTVVSVFSKLVLLRNSHRIHSGIPRLYTFIEDLCVLLSCLAYRIIFFILNVFLTSQFHPTGEAKFNSVEPYTKNRLSALPFADIIRDYKVISNGVVPENPLKFLYPDIPKDEAFSRHYNIHPSKGKRGRLLVYTGSHLLLYRPIELRRTRD